MNQPGRCGSSWVCWLVCVSLAVGRMNSFGVGGGSDRVVVGVVSATNVGGVIRVAVGGGIGAVDVWVSVGRGALMGAAKGDGRRGSAGGGGSDCQNWSVVGV